MNVKFLNYTYLMIKFLFSGCVGFSLRQVFRAVE